MVSSLQQQLNKLASGHRHETRLRKVASFLFTDEVAQEVTTEQCYKIGLRGLKGLAQLDSRFNHFFSTLYDEESVGTDRQTMVPEDAEAVDKEMDMFLWLLSPYFMQACAHEAFEYLLRHYEIHIVLTEQVLRMVMPYHDHLYFPRLVQLLPLRRTRWEFLTRLQREGCTLTRSVLVQHIFDDQSILIAIGDYLVSACDRETTHPSLLNLFNGIVVEVIHTLHAKGKNIDDRLVTAVLPVAEYLITNGTTLDAQASGHTVIATLFATTPLSEQLCVNTFLKLSQLMNENSSSRPVTPPAQLIKVMSIVASQFTPTTVVKKARVMKLLHFRWSTLFKELTQLQHSVEGASFVVLILKYMIGDGIASGGKRMGNLKALMETIDFTEKVGRVLSLHCLNQILEGSQQHIVTEILVMFEKHCCKGFDDAVKTALQTFKQDDKNKIFKWMKEGFKGTRHQPVSSDEGQFSLTVGCLHHEANVRKMSAEELVNVVRKTKDTELKKLLVHMLDIEEDASVLTALLSERDLCDLVDYKALVSVLSNLARRHTYPKPSKVAPSVVSTLVAAVAKNTDDHTALVLLTCMLQSTMLHTSKTEVKALTAAKEALTAAKPAHLKKLGKSMEVTTNSVLSFSAHVRALVKATSAGATYAKHHEECAKKALALRNRKNANMNEVLIYEDEITHCLLVATEGVQDIKPLELFCQCRDHMEAVFTQVKLSNKLSSKPDGSFFEKAVSAPTTLAQERIKYSYLMFLQFLTSPKHVEQLTDELSSKVLSDCFNLIFMAGTDPNVYEHSQAVATSFLKSSPHAAVLLSGIWTIPDIPSPVVVASVNVALSLVDKKGNMSQLIAALLCLLYNRQRDSAVLSSLSGLIIALAKAAKGEMATFLTNLKQRVTDMQAETLESIMPQILTSAITNELCSSALLMNLGTFGSVVQEVVDMTKLRGLIPCLKSVVEKDTSLNHELGLLCAAAVGAFRAIWDMEAATWKKLPDRTIVFEVLCKCLESVTPIQVTGRASSKWAHSSSAATAGSFISLPDLVASVIVDQGKMVGGFDTLFTAFSEPEKQQWITSLLALVSSGHAAGREILAACGPVLGQYIRSFATQTASKWSKSLVSKAPLNIPQPEASDNKEDESSEEEATTSKRKRSGGDGPTGKRSKDDEANNLGLTSVAEALVLLHPGIGAPLTGQDPLAVGSLMWRCLRVESIKRKSDRSEYLMHLFVTILANCAAEVAVCAKGVENPHMDTLIPKITAKDRKHEALKSVNGVFMVDFEEFVEVLISTSSATRKEGLKVFKSLMGVDPKVVYTSCLRFVVTAVGVPDVDDLLDEMLTNLIPGMLHSKDGNTLVTLIHIVLYSYASRRGINEAALSACHKLLSRCNIHYQLVALNKLLHLTVSDSVAAPEEEKLLNALSDCHPSSLSSEQITLRVVLFSLRHMVSDEFIDKVLDEEEVEDDEPEYYLSFSDLFMCLLQMYKEHAPTGTDDTDDEEDQAMPESQEEEEEDEDDEASSTLSDAEKADVGIEEDLFDLRISCVQRVKQLLVAAIDVMPIAVFVAATRTLLEDGSMELRALGLKLFNSKLDNYGSNMSDKEMHCFITMLPELKDAIDAATTMNTEKPAGSQDDATVDAIGIQSSLWTLEILARYLAPYHPRSFAHFLPPLSRLVKQYIPCIQRSEAPGMAVASSALLTFGHICHEIEALTLEHLPVVIPLLLEVCDESVAVASKCGFATPKPALRLLIQSCCSSFAKIITSISRYMSPYFTPLLKIATAAGTVTVAPEHSEKLLKALIKHAEARLLFPSVTATLSSMSTEAASHPMLWAAVGEIITETPMNEVLSRMEVMMGVVVSSMKAYTEEGLVQIPVLKSMGDAITALAMKLDAKRLTLCLGAIESPVFAYDRENAALSDQRQLVAFCVVITRMQAALGTLFCPMFRTFLPQLCEYVDTIRGYKKPTIMAVTATVLAVQLMKTCVEDDSDTVIARNSELAMLMITTAIHQLGNKSELDRELAFSDEDVTQVSGYSQVCEDLIRPLLVRLCLDVEDRQLWNKIQKQVIGVYRFSNDPIVRHTALGTLKALYVGVGQEFAAAVIAELLQTLSEALDDDDPSVSKLAVDLVKTCSQLTGEDIAGFMK
eukprot:TRINITY_DN30452_c0_g1_i1.p1 TRINITY_DN30452_c0_g1~~TRINITY_DN30452_c0_g1_i1.p1  ORF type:complete len:2119 (+),score=662.43 TRINITY_DN30452_c0_g1_i1:71-6427(+)